jgi:small-conductance mechanosensitive channel
MENQSIQNQNSGGQIPLPNATAILVLGIISIALCWCVGIVGLAAGIISLVMAGKAKALYESTPDSYTLSSYNNVKAGRICAIIGTILSAIYVIYVIIYVIFLGAAFTALPWQNL